MSSKILLRRGTAAQWSSANPILGIGELGIETDTLKIKIGNGSSTWSQLSSYANVTPAQLTSEINNLISAAPATLDTLNELAAAINNDASFSTTVNNLLTGKVSKSGGDTITSSTASTVGLIVKAAASQTANLTEWQDSAGTVLAKVASSGALSIAAATANLALGGTIGGVQYLNSIIFDSGNSTNPVHRIRWTGGGSGNPNWEIGTNTGLQTNKNWFVRYTEASPNVRDYIPLRIQGTNGTTILSAFSGQTANLQEWQNSAGTVLAAVTSSGRIWAGGMTVATSGAVTAASQFGVVISSASTVGVGIKGAASQTANLQEWQNSSGTVLSKINYDGVLASKVSLGDFWGPIWETVTAGSNDQGWKKLVVISLPDNNYSGIQFKIDINNAVTNFGSSAYPEKSTYTVAATRAGGALNDSVSMVLTGPEGDKYIRGMKLSNGTYEIQFRQPADWTEVVVRVQPISAQPSLRGLSDLYTLYPMSAGGTAASTGGTVYTPVIGGTDKFSFLSAQSFAKIGGTSSQFLKADGSVDASTYFTTATPYVAGHHAEGRYLASAALMNDLGNARLRGSTFTFTNVSPTNAQIDTMFDGTAGVVVFTTSAITFPVVIEFTLPRTLQYGATVGVGFGNATWRANSVKIEAFSNGAWVTCIDTTTNTSEDVIANIPGSNATPGTTKLRYTFANPNSTQFRICHLWGFNYNSDMWTQLQMPRAGGTMYGSLAVQGYTQTLGTTNVVQNVIRGVSGQTANLQEWQQSDGSATYIIDANGHMFASASRGLYLNTGYISGTRFAIASVGASQIGMIIRGNTSQTGNLTEWRNVSDTVLASIDANGQGAFKSTTLTASSSGGNALTLVAASGQTAPLLSTAGGAKITAGGNYFEAPGIQSNYIMTATAGNSTIVPLTAYGAASQTANLQEWKDSTGTLLSAVSNVGTVRSSIFASTTPGVTYIATNLDTSGIAIITNGAAMKGLVIRGVASQTASLQEWQDSTGTLLGRFHPTAGLLIGGVANINGGGAPYMNFGTTNFSLYPNTASNIGLIIKGAASQTANLQEWQNSSGGVDTAITSTGRLSVRTTLADAGLNVGAPSAATVAAIIRGFTSQSANLQQWQDNGGTVIARLTASGSFLSAARVSAGSSTVATANINSYIPSASLVGILVQGAASQTANLQEWQNSAGTVLLRVNSAGQIQAPQPTSVGLVVKAATTLTATITNAVGDGTTVTYTAANTFTAGQTVGVTGVDPVAYNLTSVTIASASSTQFTVTNAATGTYVSGGTASVGQSANIFESRHGDGSLNTYIDKNGQLSAYASGTPLALSRGGTNETNISFFNNAWARSLGQIRAIGTSDGAGFRLTNSTSANEYSRFTPTGVVFGNNIGALSSLAQITAYANSATTIGSVIRGAASQTAGLQQWQNSSGTVLAEITASGSLELNGKDIELMNIMGAF